MEIHVNVPFVGYKRTAADANQKERMKEWEHHLQNACIEALEDHDRFTDDVCVLIEANFPLSILAYDIDKIASWALDSIKRTVIRDDSQVRELYVRITESALPENTIIKIAPF